MLQRFKNLAVMMAVVGSFVAVPAAPALAEQGKGRGHDRDRPAPQLDVPVTGIAGGNTFAGTMSISRFAIENQKLVAIGQITGAVKDANGRVVRAVISSVSVPVSKNSTGTVGGGGGCSDEEAVVQQGCEVLSLVLGPLDLDLLGLVIELDTVVLDITAVPGAGNLLGNLLCAIVGLLDAPTVGQQIVGLLNQLIGILAGL
jgi:hypothetical protein